jgi:hypothetical protein
VHAPSVTLGPRTSAHAALSRRLRR